MKGIHGRRLTPRPHRTPADWAAALVSLPTLAAVRLTITLLPFRWWRFALAPSVPGRALPSSLWTPSRVGWAVQVTARVVPGATCLTQALAARSLLWAAGHPSTFSLGVRPGETSGIEAHAWLESGAVQVVGVPEAGHYSILRLP